MGIDFNAGVGTAEMLGRTNFIALIGGGKQPKFAQNKARGIRVLGAAAQLTTLLGDHLGRCEAEDCGADISSHISAGRSNLEDACSGCASQ
jgi:hypothetical protein